ncbi:hypothetical protein [Methylomicrobium sp. Wu6]|uniref:hypothetical protein n=1 Tax=Methylomicrobium sp. Wu6 TaxID=3107928 RepID=UPI002DD65235|nr:hypothetical protein [Methylomicrobium sp. Wu6]MEC4749884.1 hypothetical protein [Methylomicrobium sp. Wu6]
MIATDIAKYIQENVSTFQDIEILGPGVAYHYSRHSEGILANGFLGAPLTLDLDCTQSPVENHKATHNPGVVFCYESLEETAEEGDCAKYLFNECEPKIFRINFTAAVRAVHVQEALLESPPTIMISTTEIESFECLGPCSDFWDEEGF